jgi:hypothetical protein
MINFLYPPVFGGLLKLRDTPRPPAVSILHLFFSGLTSMLAAFTLKRSASV